MVFEKGQKFIDYFIHNKESLPLGELYRGRTLVLILLLGWLFTLVHTVLLFLGHFSGESSDILLIIFSLNLILLKLTRRFSLVMWILIISGTASLVYNISISGDIYSYNHKWWIIIMVITNFYLPRYSILYLFVAVGFQIYFYSITPEQIQPYGSKEDYFFDNITALIFSYVTLRFFIKLHEIQKSIIDQQNEQLKSQKKELVESNSCLLYTSPSPRDATLSRMPSSA